MSTGSPRRGGDPYSRTQADEGFDLPGLHNPECVISVATGRESCRAVLAVQWPELVTGPCLMARGLGDLRSTWWAVNSSVAMGDQKCWRAEGGAGPSHNWLSLS